jgi:hypothetical protein
MKAVVIIPFRGDPATLSWVLQGFAQQHLPPSLTVEVRVGADGSTPPPMPADVAGTRFNALSFPWCGVSEAKNLLLRNVQADVIIFGNADTRPEPGFVAGHVARLMSLPEGSLVLGAAPYQVTGLQTVFDVLREQTPMIFFYHQMKALEWYDFRRAWTLNLSVRHADFVRTGGFAIPLRPYGHEDIEFAFRLLGAQRKGLFFDPSLVVLHRHPMTFADYLNREEGLGLMGPVLHDVSPVVFEQLFGTTNLDALAAQYRAWTQMDLPTHSYIWQRMNEWVDLPESALGTGDARERLLMALYQMHIPLKRLAFRLGFLRGLELRDDIHWQQRRPAGLWKRVIGSV